MDDKEKLQQQLQELLSKADQYISEIRQLKELIIEQDKKEKPQNFQANQTFSQQPLAPAPAFQQPIAPPQFVPAKKKAKDNSSIEKYIGENLVNKIGIAVLVLGIGFFVKYAIDRNWINELTRMFIGIAAGFALMGLGYWLHKKYKAFSSVLTGGGVAALYFSFFIAYREYEILNQSATFILLLIVTLMTVFLSLWYNRRELAIIAVVGGFASPLMASNGMGNYIIFFSYLFVLNAGMIIHAYYKKWKEINIIAYFFTVVFYGSWLVMQVFVRNIDPWIGALTFGTLFYLVFFLMDIFSAFKKPGKFGAFEIVILTSNTFLFYAAGMGMFHHIGYDDFNGSFTAIFAIFNLAFALALYKKQDIARVLRYLLTSFAITFISLIAPVQFNGSYITLFWACEFVVLYWLASRSEIPMLKIFSASVLIIVLFSLVVNWMRFYVIVANEDLAVVFNKVFLTGILVNAAMLVNIILIRSEKKEFAFPGIPSRVYQSILTGLSILFLYLVILFELLYQLPQYIDEYAIRNIIAFSFTGSYFLIFLFLLRKKSPAYLTLPLTGVLFIITLIYVFASHRDNAVIRDYYLFYNKTGFGAFYYHYINFAIVLASLFLIRSVIREKLNLKWKPETYYLWYLCAMLIFLITSELDHIAVLTFYTVPLSIPEILRQTSKIGYPVLWGLSALILMLIGLRKRNTMLRIISLSVFGLILLKLFLFDIWDMPAGGKTAAFIILGVILLLVSFLYQKLKKILFGNQEEEDSKAQELPRV